MRVTADLPAMAWSESGPLGASVAHRRWRAVRAVVCACTGTCHSGGDIRWSGSRWPRVAGFGDGMAWPGGGDAVMGVAGVWPRGTDSCVRVYSMLAGTRCAGEECGRTA